MKQYHNLFICLESQQKAGEVCQMCFTQLRSGFIIKKKACFFGKETTNGYSSKTGKGKLYFLVILQYSDSEHLFAISCHI